MISLACTLVSALVLSQSTPVESRPDAAPGAVQAAAELARQGVRLQRDGQQAVKGLTAAEGQLDDAALRRVGVIADLESIEITGGAITGTGLAELGQLASLHKLYLKEIPLADKDLAFLRKLTGLRVLALPRTGIDGSGLVHLAGLHDLEVLNLADNPISDESLDALKGLTQINTLVLQKSRVTDAGLARLAPLAKLRVLNLSSCRISDKGFAHLLDHDSLRMLYLYDTKVTEPRVEDFNDQMPGLAIYY